MTLRLFVLPEDNLCRCPQLIVTTGTYNDTLHPRLIPCAGTFGNYTILIKDNSISKCFYKSLIKIHFSLSEYSLIFCNDVLLLALTEDVKSSQNIIYFFLNCI